MVRRSTRKGAQKEPGFFKDSLYRVGKYANSGPRKNGTGTEKPRYAQPDGLTGEGLFADLETSYVGTVPSAPPRKLGKRQPRWQHQGPSPITEKWKVPLGWNDREPDLDPR